MIAAMHENQGATSNLVYLLSGRLLSEHEIIATIEHPDHSDKSFLITGSLKIVN